MRLMSSVALLEKNNKVIYKNHQIKSYRQYSARMCLPLLVRGTFEPRGIRFDPSVQAAQRLLPRETALLLYCTKRLEVDLPKVCKGSIAT